MIQRIQTIWLLLAAVLGFLITRVALFEGLNAGIADTYTATEFLPTFAVSIIASVLALVAIFLFKNRKLQKKLTLFGLLLSVIVIGLEVLMYKNYQQEPDITNATYSWGALLPIGMVIFFFMAWSGIRKDEKLIKSLDRLR